MTFAEPRSDPATTVPDLPDLPNAPIERRVDAVQAAMDERGMAASAAVDALSHSAQEEWVPHNGARLVARAWVDPAFRARLLTEGHQTVLDFGFTMPRHHRHFVVLENSATVHNVICCTLCSCSAIRLLGLPPDWYKELDYRARIVRESRTVLREMGLVIDPAVELRVWDTTADTRYMVLPQRPAHTAGWSEAALAAIVTRDGMFGVARL